MATPLSERVLQGSRTKGSTAINLGELTTLVSIDDHRQGINIRNIGDAFGSLSHKMRSNSEYIRTYKGKDFDSLIFNDIFTPIMSGSLSDKPAPDIAGRLSQRIGHQIENRDLGQSSHYDDNTPYVELANPNDAIAILGMLDRNKQLPAGLVDHSSNSSLDGKIDPLGTIKSIDRSSIDHPYEALGVKGSVNAGQDSFLRCFLIEDRFMIPGNSKPTEYYLDAPENFGNVIIQGVSNTNLLSIEPFNDVSGDVEDYVNKNISDTDMSAVLKRNTFFIENDLGNFDKMATGGFDYGGGADSLSFGGLKK